MRSSVWNPPSFGYGKVGRLWELSTFPIVLHVDIDPGLEPRFVRNVTVASRWRALLAEPLFCLTPTIALGAVRLFSG